MSFVPPDSLVVQLGPWLYSFQDAAGFLVAWTVPSQHPMSQWPAGFMPPAQQLDGARLYGTFEEARDAMRAWHA